MATIRIHTAQNVTLEYEVASIGDRLVAALLDTLISVAWVLLVIWVLDRGLKIHGSLQDWLLLAFAVVPYVFYNLACELLLDGQSPGKKARHLRVVRLDGTSPRLGDYLLRWLLRVIDTGMPIFSWAVGIITIAASGRGQRLGDMAAGTTVINLRPKTAAPLDLGAVHTDYQPVFAQADQLTDQDVALVRQLLERSTRNDNHLLLHDTALKVKQLLQVESELGDEAFLRTILRDHAHLLLTAE